jgi:hypothetical protein
VHCGTSCCRLCEDPSGAPALTTLPVSGGSELRGARLGMAGKTAVASSTASPLSAQGGARWQGVGRGIAGNVDRPSGSALQLPSPPGGEGNMAAAGLGVGPLSGRGGLLTTRVSSELTGVSSELAGVSSKLTGVSSELTGVSSELTGVSSEPHPPTEDR